MPCVACPAGANCGAHHGILLNETVPLPGYWRVDPSKDIFLDCTDGYLGSSGKKYALERCCPSTLNCTGSGDAQCTAGYSGPLCRNCAVNHVMVSDHCIPCKGGPMFDSAVMVVVGISALVFVLFLLVLLRIRKRSATATTGASAKLFGQIKIVLGFLQILSSMPVTMNNVPWPENFVNFTLHLDFINFDFLDVFVGGSCNLSLSPLDRFVLHMMTVPIVTLAFVLAFIVSVKCTSKTSKSKSSKSTKSTQEKQKEKQKMIYQVRKETTAKALILFILLCYPGLATRIFSVLRCVKFSGIDGSLLQQDFAVQCYVGEHALHMSLAFIFIGLYVAGVPITIFVLLWRNRKHLHNEASPKHLEIKYELGGLYAQYEPYYWWYELVNILTKMLMTGALCIVTPGSPVQLVTAILIMSIYMIAILKMTPFQSSSDDWMR
jgi:heme/copper-type cytochrome/quinol oxidase subunit 2